MTSFSLSVKCQLNLLVYGNFTTAFDLGTPQTHGVSSTWAKLDHPSNPPLPPLSSHALLSVKHHYDLKTTWNMNIPSSSFTGHVQTYLSHQSQRTVTRWCSFFLCVRLLELKWAEVNCWVDLDWENRNWPLGRRAFVSVCGGPWLWHITEPCFRSTQKVLNTEIVNNRLTV